MRELSEQEVVRREKLKNIKEPGKSISEVFQEAKENTKEEPVEEKTLSPKEELMNILTKLGFDYLDFTTNDLEKVLANYNERIWTKSK